MCGYLQSLFPSACSSVAGIHLLPDSQSEFIKKNNVDPDQLASSEAN